MKFRLVALLLVLSMAGVAWAREAREQARIDFLIHEVETSTGIRFIRNGSEYDGPAGASQDPPEAAAMDAEKYLSEQGSDA